jgi:hypothetical protein
MPERPTAHSIERDTSLGVARVRLTCRECAEAGMVDAAVQRKETDTTGEWDSLCRAFLKTHPIPFCPVREFKLSYTGLGGYKTWGTPDARWTMYMDRQWFNSRSRGKGYDVTRYLFDHLTLRMWEPRSYNEALQIIRRNTEGL